jgi:ATP-dependent DNA helicase DinG
MPPFSKEHKKSIEGYLGKTGVLCRELSGYEYRLEQIQMAEAALQTLTDRGILVVEAGTGTGKTLAYLVPAILSNQRVIISTGTKTLQEQIFFKDLPLLHRHFNFKAVMMKGRANYLCWRRFHKFSRQPKMEFISDAEIIEQIREWSETSESGDREELKELSEDNPLWSKISSDTDLCFGSSCQHFRECFVTKLKMKAQGSEIIVVNHSLFFADLAIRKLGFGEVIPRYQAVIFDESHILEDVITEYFGVNASDRRMLELSHDLASESGDLSKHEAREMGRIAARIENLTETTFSGLKKHLENLAAEEEGKRIPFNISDAPVLVVKTGFELARELSQAGAILSAKTDSPDLLGLSQRASKQAGDIDFLLRQDEPGFVYYADMRPRSVILRASPLEVGGLLKESFYPALESIIFTSATLTTSQKKEPSFEYFKNRMGLAEAPRVKELWLKTSFDFKNQAVLFLPKELPLPDHPNFVPEASAVVEELLEITRGRAFLLFTSYRNLEAFYERLSARVKYPMLKQGDRPRSELLREFREVEESILFATMSFWQGVDVVGPALSLVVIDRLPFDSPGDPLIKARINAVNASGGNAFLDYQVPSAVIMLRQGLGRLIRSKKDRGALSVLDSRIQKKSYGKIFLESLPDTPITHSLKSVREFFEGGNPR